MADETARERTPWLLETVALFLMFVDMLLSGGAEARSVTDLSRLIGATFAPPVTALIVIAIVKAFKGVRSRRGTAQLALGIFAFFFLGALGQGSSMHSRGEGKQLEVGSAEWLSSVAAAASKTVPKKVDAETELVGIRADGKTLVYSYRLLRLLAADVHGSGKDSLRKAIIGRTCAPGTLKDQFLRNGIVMRHSFSDKEHQPVVSVDVTLADCGGKG